MANMTCCVTFPLYLCLKQHGMGDACTLAHSNQPEIEMRESRSEYSANNSLAATKLPVPRVIKLRPTLFQRVMRAIYRWL